MEAFRSFSRTTHLNFLLFSIIVSGVKKDVFNFWEKLYGLNLARWNRLATLFFSSKILKFFYLKLFSSKIENFLFFLFFNCNTVRIVEVEIFGFMPFSNWPNFEKNGQKQVILGLKWLKMRVSQTLFLPNYVLFVSKFVFRVISRYT